MARPRLLIEEWLPIDVIGAESMRDASAAQKPPLNRLHVWWARRPLTASRAAILSSLLPVWSDAWPGALLKRFPDEASYRAWFLKACGILGDPVRGQRRILAAKDTGEKLADGGYGYPRAFTVSPDEETAATIRALMRTAWGDRETTVLDPFSGGGAIPFEALRYGFSVTANELNPVACVILKATLEYPARFGPELANDIRKYGAMLCSAVEKRLAPFFPKQKDASTHAYLWARTVACPYTGKPIPLAPNWWLKKDDGPVAVRPIFDEGADRARFEIIKGAPAVENARPDSGTVRGGNAVSPWANNQTVDGDYIKAEAQAGRMGQQLYALALKRAHGFDFVVPTGADEEAAEEAARELTRRRSAWEAAGLVPVDLLPMDSESWTHGNTPAQYDARRFSDIFAPRQLLSLCTYLEELRALVPSIEGDLGARSDAIRTYLALALDKAADYNAVLSTWEKSRQVAKHVFKRHDFAFSWSFSEYDAARNLFTWSVEQVSDAYKNIAKLAAPSTNLLQDGVFAKAIAMTRGNAAALSSIPDGSILLVCTDPPYEANVMYAELSDFFYVWMKRSLGDVYPDFLRDMLTNKDDEAVANVGRFKDFGKKKKQLALDDYQRKMFAAFREMHRVLADDGVLTVMFTHKQVAAWDSLAMALIEAGFAIHASWPVHTESEHSLHQAKKNAAKSTIFLACRKRAPSKEPVWWDDLRETVRRTAREKAAEFEKLGIHGVDLYIATFGPTLAILSESWPVLTSEADERTGEPKPLRPEVALDLARAEVVGLRRQGLLLGRKVQFDKETDWYVLAWDAFKAAEFPADEARKLALALDLDLEKNLVSQRRLITKKQSTVVFQLPKDRRRKGVVDAEAESFSCLVDAVHTAMLVQAEDGTKACDAFLTRTGLKRDAAFKACLQALLNAIPRTQSKGKFVRPEAKLVEDLRLAFFDDLVAPPDEMPAVVAEQASLYGEDGLEESDEEEEDVEE